MKRVLKLFVFMLVALMSFSLTVSAKIKETYFEEDGVQYCWLRGSSTEEPDPVPGYRWVKVYGEDGRPITQLGQCDDHDNADDCDLFCAQLRLEYMYQLVNKEVMLIEALNEKGYAMIGADFVLVQHQIKTNQDGSYDLDANGNLQYDNSVVIGRGTVEKDGYAKMRLDENRLDFDQEHLQLVLAQNLSEELLDTYMAVQKKWFVNLVLQDGVYEVYSVKDAPYEDKIKDPNELKEHGFGQLEPEATDEFNYTNQMLKTRNYFRVGDIIVNISVEGFLSEVPERVRTNITIAGPEGYSKKIKSSETLKDLNMGEYTISYSNPVSVDNYTAQKPVVTVQCPVNADPVEMTGDVKTVLLNRDHSNAIVNITYTYVAKHIHAYDDGVITDATCTAEGYTTFTCLDPECGHSYRADYTDMYGHTFKEERTKQTCTTAQGMLYSCLYCDYYYTEEEKPAKGHDYGEGKVTPPTCWEAGYTTYTCKTCGLSYEDDEVAALEHRYKKTDPTAPTCTEPGYEVKICLKCNDVQKEPVEPAYGHNYDEGVVTGPTCSQKGYTTYTCLNAGCGYSFRGDEVDATEHEYVDTVISPTTEKEGYTVHVCSICKNTYTDEYKDRLPKNTSSDSSSNDAPAQAPAPTPAPVVTPVTGNSSTTTANSSGPATLLVKSVDDLENSLNGTTIALYNGRTLLNSWTSTYENVAVLDNLGDYVKEGENISLTLVQTKVPGGYDVSEDSFTVRLSKRGGKVDIDVKKDSGLFDGDVSKSKDGKPIVTFVSDRQVAQVGIICDVAVKFAADGEENEALAEQYQNRNYEFILKWKDTDGEEQTESVMLTHSGVALLETELPLGTSYEITGIDAEGNALTGLSANAKGTISSKMVEENLVVEANLKYTVINGSDLELKLTVVDGQSGKPLEGISFDLKDPEGKKIGTYFSHRNGEIYIVDTFKETGNYLLTQTAVAEGYGPIRGDAPIVISEVYTSDEERGAQFVVQSLAAEIPHQAISQDENGVFVIKNMPEGYKASGTSKGFGLKRILGIIAAVLALIIGSILVFIGGRILRKKFGIDDAEVEADAAENGEGMDSESDDTAEDDSFDGIEA